MSVPSGQQSHSTPPLDAEQQALAWFSRLQDNQRGTQDQQAFADWLAQDPANRAAYDKVVELWQSPTLAEALSHFAAVPARPVSKPAPIKRWAAAACLLLACGWLAGASGLLNRWQADMTTAAGQQYRAQLADGSSLILNTDSAVKLAYSDDVRGVTLLQGEAYFEVAPNPTKPFIVTTAQGSVKVVGTRFSVKTGDTTEVNVESGQVLCLSAQGESRQLSAGQHTRIEREKVAEINPIDSEQIFAWLKGRLIFQDRPLAEVVAELERYQPGLIVIADPELGQVRISGNYKLEDTSALLKTLAEIAGAKLIRLSPYLSVLQS